MNYWIYQAGQQSGPYSKEQLLEMWRSGTVNAETVYCVEGASEWKPIMELVLRRKFVTRPLVILGIVVMVFITAILVNGYIKQYRIRQLVERVERVEEKPSAQTMPEPTPEPLPSNKPDSFREVVGIRNASGVFTLGFILSDENGRDTTAEGEVEVTIYGGGTDYFKKTYTIERGNFKRTSGGIVHILGRVNQLDFQTQPDRNSGAHLLMVFRGRNPWSLCRGESIVYFQ